MEKTNIDLFIATMTDKFPAESIMSVRSQLEKIPDEKLPLLQALSYKNPIILLVVSLFLGGLGVDRFMLGHTGLGVLKLLTCGGFGIWAIVDWFTVMNSAKKANLLLFMQHAH